MSILFIKVVIFTGASLYLMGIMWMLYLAVMNLMEHRDRLTLPAKLFAYPIAAAGVVADALFNITFGTVIFVEPPHYKRLLFTQRCQYHLKEDGYRGKVARFWCRHFLDPFDPTGRHC